LCLHIKLACRLLPCLSSKADTERRGLSFIKNDGWKGPAGKPEYATQEEAQKSRVVQQSESGGKHGYKAPLFRSAEIYP